MMRGVEGLCRPMQKIKNMILLLAGVKKQDAVIPIGN